MSHQFAGINNINPERVGLVKKVLGVATVGAVIQFTEFCYEVSKTAGSIWAPSVNLIFGLMVRYCEWWNEGTQHVASRARAHHIPTCCFTWLPERTPGQHFASRARAHHILTCCFTRCPNPNPYSTCSPCVCPPTHSSHPLHPSCRFPLVVTLEPRTTRRSC